jgi:hypothetical protein
MATVGFALGAGGADLLHIAQPLELALHGKGDQLFHVLGSHAFIGGGHKDIGDGDVRLGFPGQHHIAEYPHQNQKEQQHQTVDCRFRATRLSIIW